MSLINEALKKAQRQRSEAPVTLTPPASVPVASGMSAPAPRIAKRRPPMPARTQILLLGGGGAVLIMAGVLAFLFLAPESAPPAPVAKPVVAVQPPAVPVPVPADVPPSPPVQVAVTLPVPAPVPVQPPVVVAPVAPVAPVPVVTPKAPVQAMPSVPTANPKVYEFLEALRISGIRVSDTDPKVIMNDRVFRLNDVVDRITQLRLTRIESGTLIFVDPSGFEYRKSF